MTCYNPLKGWRSATPNSSGKHPITFDHSKTYQDIELTVTVPCGQCIGCRLDRSLQWAIRCVHEAQMHEDNSFITLTYNDQNLPPDGSLDIVVFQKFMKRLRKKISPVKIRFYACGEYGENFGRPHYHACIFGYAFPDKKPWQKSNDQILCRSSLLESCWPFGYSSIGEVSLASAAYVARYIVKKINGKKAANHYERIDPETGEITSRKPEYTNMSRGGTTGKSNRNMGGIGSLWLEQFLSDVYPLDFVVINNKKLRPPKFYDAKYELFSPDEHQKMKTKRKENGLLHEMDNTPERLAVKETVQKSKLKHLPRNLK